MNLTFSTWLNPWLSPSDYIRTRCSMNRSRGKWLYFTRKHHLETPTNSKETDCFWPCRPCSISSIRPSGIHYLGPSVFWAHISTLGARSRSMRHRSCSWSICNQPGVVRLAHMYLYRTGMRETLGPRMYRQSSQSQKAGLSTERSSMVQLELDEQELNVFLSFVTLHEPISQASEESPHSLVVALFICMFITAFNHATVLIHSFNK